MAQPVLYGSTLTDLGRSVVEEDALNTKRQLERMSQFFQLAARRADLDARRQEAEKDRALRFFEVGQQRSLKERDLDLEDKRLTQEANRWAEALKVQQSEGAATRTSTENIAKLQFDPKRLDPRVAGDIATIRANVAERNARAKAAAARANTLLPSVREKRASEWFTNTKSAEAEPVPRYINDIYQSLGEDASLISYDIPSRAFVPIVMEDAMPASPLPPNPLPATSPLPVAPMALPTGSVPTGRGFVPAGPTIFDFLSESAPAMPIPPTAPVLRWDLTNRTFVPRF